MENTEEGDGSGDAYERSDSKGGGAAGGGRQQVGRVTKVIRFECSVDEAPNRRSKPRERSPKDERYL